MIINPVRFKIHANFANVIHKIYSIIIFVWKLISKFFNKSQKIYKLNNELLNIERILYFYFCYKLSVITFFSCIKLLYLSIIVCLEYIMKTTGLTITDKGLLSLMMQMFKGYCCEWFATSPFKGSATFCLVTICLVTFCLVTFCLVTFCLVTFCLGNSLPG